MNLFKDLNFKSVDNIKKFELDYLKEQVTKWLEDCLSDLKTSFSQNFKYANNLKSLVIIRDSIIEFESNIQNDALLIKNQQFKWTFVCEKLFNKKIEIWSLLISPFYYIQAKVIRIIIINC